MRHRFDIQNILAGIVGYKGLPFPGIYTGRERTSRESYTGADFNGIDSVAPEQQYLKNGTPLYARDHLGRWYFMPVYFSTKEKTVEFPYAVISVKGGKNIVETTLVGTNKGSVNELISHKGYTISLAGMILSDDLTYPEDKITELRELIALNESVELVCALTDLLLDPDDKVIIKDYDYPPTPGLENGQAVKLELKTDSPFELTID